jgi:3-hydroxyisobutyrate dehydrogenase-like beta-hydroxyacid dehydrogenase
MQPFVANGADGAPSVAGLFRRAVAAGYGEEDVAALVKVLRHTDGT